MEYCEKCKENTYHRIIRHFPIPNNKHRIWVACEKCNTIKVRIK